MSGFDDALATARRDAQFLDDVAWSQRQAQAAFDAEITAVLIEAAEKFRALPAALSLQLVRPKRLFERARADLTDGHRGRYVVISAQRCWIVPPYGNRSHGSDVVFTEHGGLLYAVTRGAYIPPGAPLPVTSLNPTVVPVTSMPKAVDVRKEFNHGRRYDEQQQTAILRSLRSALAQCFVEYERAAAAGEPIEDLFRKWPIQWRRS
ncbi:hypothetical protein [Nocardia neocaledoniensis]|uniref:hypothetical protein n=1 Tax=Nocardia neocaledoniensis TaxID=236511 RepID=UPI0024587F21|nr:hypothetical protein [Nocardia neocaledoniensis]